MALALLGHFDNYHLFGMGSVVINKPTSWLACSQASG